MAFSVVNHLFKHMVEKVDVEILKIKIHEKENVLAKQAKYIKQINSSLD